MQNYGALLIPVNETQKYVCFLLDDNVAKNTRNRSNFSSFGSFWIGTEKDNNTLTLNVFCCYAYTHWSSLQVYRLVTSYFTSLYHICALPLLSNRIGKKQTYFFASSIGLLRQHHLNESSPFWWCGWGFCVLSLRYT